MSVLNPTQEQLSVLKEHYKDIILNWPEGYDFCEVCLIKEGMQQDDLIFCELCNGLVHQSCYGGELLDSIPENDWYCERCREYIRDYMNEQKLHDLSSIRCYFCPEQKGIVKKVTIQHSGTQIWSHVGCVSSIKSLNFVDSTRNLIVQKYSPKRTTDECKICGLKTGNCGYCHTSGCNFTFHFSCGKRIGIIQDVITMNTLMECREKQYKNSEPEHHVVFCEEHLYNLSYVEYPNDKFLKEFIQNMYIQRETFENEGDNLSVLIANQQKCDKIEYNKSQLQEKYIQKKQQLRKSKKTSSNSLPQSKQNIRDKSRSRSRSRSPPKSDRKIAGGKKPKSSESQLEISEKEIGASKKPAQKSKAAQSQSQTGSKAPSKGKKEEENKSQQSNPTQAGKSKGGISSSQSLSQNDKANKSKVAATTAAVSLQPQNQQTSSKNDQNSQSGLSQTKKQTKKGKNDDEQSNQLIENQDNWRRIQNVMQKYDYREKQFNNNSNNNSEEQKSNDEAFKTPFYILEELNKTLPKRTTVETSLKSDATEKKDNLEQSEDSKVLQNNYDECSNSEFRDSSSNMMQMIELDSTVLDQDKIIEEQKQSELQTNYQNTSNSNKDKMFVVPIPKSSQSKEVKDINNQEDAEQSSKKLQKKPNKLSDDEKSRVYKKFIIEYVKLNRSKLQGPQSLYIIHPEMMQIMQIQAALPQRKWKKEIAHFFVQKECLNPIQKEVQIKKCINQRIIDLFSDRNIPTNIPSKNFYKLFKANFMIKVYDNVKQLSEYEDILDNAQESQENQDNQVKPTSLSQEENEIQPNQIAQNQQQTTEICKKQQDQPLKDNQIVEENAVDHEKLCQNLPEKMQEEKIQNGDIHQQIQSDQQENQAVQQDNKDAQQEIQKDQQENKDFQKNQNPQEESKNVDSEKIVQNENQNVIEEEIQKPQSENKNIEQENQNIQQQVQNVQSEDQNIQQEIKSNQQENQNAQQDDQNLKQDNSSDKQENLNIQEENQKVQQENESTQQNNQNVEQEHSQQEKQSEKDILAELPESVNQKDDLKNTETQNKQQENESFKQNPTQESESKMQIESEQPNLQVEEQTVNDHQKMQIEDGEDKAPQQEQVQEVVQNQQSESSSNNNQ
ncbi:PHD zinc finger protein (macronuclear) [Tetrahymena thermophila SB210]|uniref:PHD zinc finger protein n=1 Tax=Tetrahymena thermophila (strain SB210) TaxID=312017 RepID=Q23C58_TETTS|nr:PHD zinc finger protein [Tetrahymena thermophila SB210]EAR93910.3 PHD zinc finger protein [Tetrahymena thermophila SB210]|eukprot:XP_001014155.3 PHD zinc finger protein [Tetrahymena thermophila SB210]